MFRSAIPEILTVYAWILLINVKKTVCRYLFYLCSNIDFYEKGAKFPLFKRQSLLEVMLRHGWISGCERRGTSGTRSKKPFVHITSRAGDKGPMYKLYTGDS